jgi:hypothetical protein
LTDLFQLMGQQQKTGVLNLQEGKKIVQVNFDKGMIVGTSFPSESEEESSLGKRLICGGLLTPEKWKKAIEQRKEKLVSIEKILIDNGLVSREDLTAVLRLLTFETIYNLFKWKGGTFQFETKQVLYDPSFAEPLSAEYLLLDVLRMVDEWPMLAERIPSFNMVFQKVNSMATLDVLAGTPWEKMRTFQMDVIYELVNGLRTVQEIMDLSFVGEFDACKNLIILMDSGLVESTSIKTGKEKRPAAPLHQNLKDIGAYAVTGLIGLFLIYQLIVTRGENFPFSAGDRQKWLNFQEPIRQIEKLSAQSSREVFWIEENRYPANSSEMLNKGLLRR